MAETATQSTYGISFCISAGFLHSCFTLFGEIERRGRDKE